MNLRFIPLLFEILMPISTVFSVNVGFFCNNGGYSHDMYSNYLADSMASQKSHNVSIIQIKVYKCFKGMKFSRPAISFDFSDDPEAVQAQIDLLRLVWNVIIPFDAYNLSGTFEGTKILLKNQDSCSRACEAAFEDSTFLSQLRSLNLEFLVIDYNHCGTQTARWINIPIAYVSSAGLGADYVGLLGVPSNPAYVPVFFSNYEPYESFAERAMNTFGYVILVGYQTFGQSEFQQPLMVATAWEMFLDMPRPIARNVRYFGCEMFSNKETDSAKSDRQLDFTQKSKGIVLVSFGSSVKFEDIPTEKLQSFVEAFASFPQYAFLWQLNVSPEEFETAILRPNGIKMPENIRLHRWLPMKKLLAHPKTHLLITHGGATSCLEAAYSAVPVFTIALHSDQFSNAQRMAHRRLGESMVATEVEGELLADQLHMMLRDIQYYKRRAAKFRHMLLDYREFRNASSTFWLDFLARHFGKRSQKSKEKARKYWSLKNPGWIAFYYFDTMCVFMLLLYLLV